MRLLGGALQKDLRQARLAYPGFSRQQHDVSISRPRLLPAAQEQRGLVVPADERRAGGAGVAKRLSAASLPSACQARTSRSKPLSATVPRSR
jgi:hypothetical protein